MKFEIHLLLQLMAAARKHRDLTLRSCGCAICGFLKEKGVT